MNIKKMKKEDLELLSYNDIAYMILSENKEASTATLFRQIVDLLELGDKVYENKIGNFYTSLTTDKRFILLESGNWDLKENHPTNNIIIDEDDDIEEIEQDVMDDYEGEGEEEEEDPFREDTEDDVDDVAEEYKNLVIIDEEDFESGE